MRTAKVKSRVPDGQSGIWQVNRIVAENVGLANFRAKVNYGMQPLVEGETYTRLLRDGNVIMSDTPDELLQLESVRYCAARYGSVLVTGLGLGLAVQMALTPGCKRVVVVEKSPDVIKLVAPSFAKERRVKIIEGDAFTFDPVKAGVLKPEEKFGLVWHDIWDSICASNLPEMRKLTRRYKLWSDNIQCWQEHGCLRMRRMERSYR